MLGLFYGFQVYMPILHQIHKLDQPSSAGAYVLLHTFLLLHDNQVVLGEVALFWFH